MDSKRFDDLARFIGAKPSRRGLLKALAGGALGSVGTMVGISAAGAARLRSVGNSCNSNSDCASALCVEESRSRKICHCVSASDCPASTDQCQYAVCASGACGFAIDAGAPCDDGLKCTQNDHCQNDGSCVGAPIECVASDACHLAGICNPATGVCSDPIAPDGTGCDDGDACTVNDVCSGGICTPGGPKSCAGGEACCGNDCIDVTSDEANCGGCGVTCGAEETCLAGACCPANRTCEVDGGIVCCSAGTVCKGDDGPLHICCAAEQNLCASLIDPNEQPSADNLSLICCDGVCAGIPGPGYILGACCAGPACPAGFGTACCAADEGCSMLPDGILPSFTGGICCPDGRSGCMSPSFQPFCCDAGEICVVIGPGTGVCCPTGVDGCLNPDTHPAQLTCCAGGNTCNQLVLGGQAQGIAVCCPPGINSCVSQAGATCCEAGESCILAGEGGICCPPGKTACESGSVFSCCDPV